MVLRVLFCIVEVMVLLIVKKDWLYVILIWVFFVWISCCFVFLGMKIKF